MGSLWGCGCAEAKEWWAQVTPFCLLVPVPVEYFCLFVWFVFRRVGNLPINSSVSYTSLDWETSSRSRLDPSSSSAGHYPVIDVTLTLLNPVVGVKGGPTL